MNIAVLSDFETYGGAATATSRLSQELCEAGITVTRIVAHEDGNKHSWRTIPLNQKRLMDRITRKSPASEKRMLKRLEDLLESIRPQVINVHNIHGALSEGWSIDFLSVCKNFAPTIWTLHDMWSFTGRCAYSYDCRKFIDGCDSNCPTPDEYPSLAPDQIKPAWLNRQAILTNEKRISCVTPSQWMANEARAGIWNKSQIDVIPNGLPLEIFKPVDRAYAREELGIASKGIVMVSVAQNFDERRKGGIYLQEGLSHILNQDLTLIVMGQGKLEMPSDRLRICSLGFVAEDRIKTLAYSAADFLIHTAPVDNFPNVIVEAMACGTPTVAFDVCGIPELIRTGVTGWLAKEVNASSLSNTVQTAIQDIQSGINLRASCRNVVEAEYPLSLQAKRYADLFSKLAS